MSILAWLAAKMAVRQFRLIAICIAVLAATLFVSAAVYKIHHAGVLYGKATIQARWDADRSAMIVAHNKAIVERDVESTRRVTLQTEIADEERAKRLTFEDSARRLRSLLDRVATVNADGERRLRDAIASSDLATRAGVGDSASAGQCAPALEAADLRGRLLQGYDDLAGRLTQRVGDASATVAGFADQAYSSASECAGRYDALIKR
jgi:hypothetical protein